MNINVISSFEDVEHLNRYYSNSFDDHRIIPIDSKELFHIINTSIDLFLTSANEEITSFNAQEQAERFVYNILNVSLDLNENFDLWKTSWTNENTPTYLFIGSKSSYRKIIHSNVVDSLYTNLYNHLKKVNAITAATGQHVILHAHKFDQDDLSCIQPNSQIDIKILESAIDYVSTLKKDNEFYQKKVSELNEIIISLETEINVLSTQLYNKTLTSWY